MINIEYCERIKEIKQSKITLYPRLKKSVRKIKGIFIRTIFLLQLQLIMVLLKPYPMSPIVSVITY